MESKEAVMRGLIVIAAVGLVIPFGLWGIFQTGLAAIVGFVAWVAVVLFYIWRYRDIIE
jgi:hypothetical protein